MKRKEILPKWIRFFAWLFLMFSIAPVIWICGLFIDGEYSLSMFGWSYSGSNTAHPVAFGISLILTIASMVSIGILWGKNWAMKLGIVYGILGIIACLGAMVLSIIQGGFYFTIEIVFLVFFVKNLKEKRKEWESFDPKETITSISEKTTI